jgi:3'(2'), 5'-bisphosphate nucleotidase
MIEEVLQIVRGAGACILSHYKNPDTSFLEKEDRSPLTSADLSSHDYLSKNLSRYGLPIVSEESSPIASDVKNYRKYWLIDPLDGTKDFIAKNDEFAICVALIELGIPKLGVVYAPALDEMYFAEKGKGAYSDIAGIRTKLGKCRLDTKTVARSRFHDSEAIVDFMKLNRLEDSKPIGSALKFGRLAKGDVQIYPRFTGSKEWDIAAGHLILTEAGGSIVDLKTRVEPQYQKDDFRNSPFLAVSAGFNPMDLSLEGINI